jgi:hypothetical protein
MKSKVLKTAWLLFREFDVTFSEALKEAWIRIKREFLRIEFAETMDKSLVSKFNSLKPTFFKQRNSSNEIVVVDNLGASFYYDGKTFNND